MSRGGLKFTKSSERPKVRLESRKSADLESRLNLKSGDEEVKGSIEEEGNVDFFSKSLKIVAVSVLASNRGDGAWNLEDSEHPQQAPCTKQKQSQCCVGGGLPSKANFFCCFEEKSSNSNMIYKIIA